MRLGSKLNLLAFAATLLLTAELTSASQISSSLVTIAASYGAGGSPINGISIASSISYPVLNDWGEIAFRAEEYSWPGYHINTAWFVSASGTIHKLASAGSAIPGTPSDVFDTFIYMS